MRILLIIPLFIFAISCKEVENSNSEVTSEVKERTATSVFVELENLHKELLPSRKTQSLKSAPGLSLTKEPFLAPTWKSTISRLT